MPVFSKFSNVLKRDVYMVDGMVRLYNNPWKFGFIVKEDGRQVFFHDSGVTVGHVREDDMVEFDIYDSPRGPRAVNIRKV